MPASLRICQVASEFAPLAKTGGLGDVIGALSRQLHREGHQVRVFLPFYSSIDTRGLRLHPVQAAHEVALQLGDHRFHFSLIEARAGEGDLPVLLIDCPALFHRAGIYTTDADDHLRFLLLTRAAIESCQRLEFAPHIFHCHDWHASFAPLFLRSVYAWDRLFAGTRTVLTLHNVGYQGRLPATAAGDLSLGAATSLLDAHDLAQGHINPLKHGILYADALTTVSPTHAREICTDEYGMGLQALLRGRSDALTGILNGIDTAEWNPATDRHLPHRYDARRLSGKKQNKKSLLEKLGLAPAPAAPLCGIVSRMTRQKGFDLLFESLPRLLVTHDLRLAVLGSGEAYYEKFFTDLQQRFPDKVSFQSGYDEALAHLIEAGSDIFLMPSRYEPCGLNQMYSLRYGTVPIVRRTGGLADSVQHFDPIAQTGTGVVFNDYDSAAMDWAIATALQWYRDRPLWKCLMLNGMSQDFSWDKQVGRYEEIYRRLIEVPQTAIEL